MPDGYNVVPLIGLGNGVKSKFVSDQRRVNLYAEKKLDVDKTPIALYTRPGMKKFATYADTQFGGLPIVRGMALDSFPHNSNDQYMIGAAGGDLIQILPQYGLIQNIWGTGLRTTQGPVQFSDNGVQIMFVDGLTGYWIDVNNLPVINYLEATPNFPVGPKTVCFLASRFIVPDPAHAGRFQWSNLLDASIWDPLNFATAESNPDPLVAVFENSGQLLLLGTFSTEFWAPQTTGAAFGRVGGSGIDWGCAAPFSVAKFQSGVVMLARNRGSERQVVLINGYQAQVISNPDVEWDINQDNSAESATAFSYTKAGHAFYQLNLSNRTWVFDGLNGEWNEATTDDGKQSAKYCQPGFSGRLITSDYRDGRMYTLENDYFYDDESPIKREWITKHVASNMNRMTVDELLIDCKVGAQDVVTRPLANTFDGVSNYISVNFPQTLVTTVCEFWVYPTSDSGPSNEQQILVYRGNTTTPRDCQFWAYYTPFNDRITFNVSTLDSAGQIVAQNIKPHIWTHIALEIYDLAQGVGTPVYAMIMFVNGVFLNVAQAIGTAWSALDGPLFIGYASNLSIPAAGHFKGYIGQMRVWNTTRNTPQIYNNMNVSNSTFGATYPGLIFAQDALALDGPPGEAGVVEMTAFEERRSPQMMLQMSVDNGHTWGYEQWRSMGALGEYRTQVIWKRLGRGVDFLYRIRWADPVDVTVVNGLIRVSP